MNHNTSTRSASALILDLPKDKILLFLLLLVDITLILFEILYRFSDLRLNNNFLLARNFGYGEIFQYVKEFWTAVLLLFIAVKKRRPLYLVFSLLFLYILADDALEIHEGLGRSLAGFLNLLPFLGLRAEDIGELAVFAFFGVHFLILIGIHHVQSDTATRAVSRRMLLLIAVMILFGAVFDMVHVIVDHPVATPILGILEDGGEMLVMSLIAWYVFRLYLMNGEIPVAVDSVRSSSKSWSFLPALARKTIFDRVSHLPFSALSVLFLNIILLEVFAGVLAWIQSSTTAIPGYDGYYHIKMAYLMRTRGLVPEFPWLPLTILNPSDFSDHHFLYHVLLIPFTLIDLRAGAKLAAVLSPALAFLAVWWLLRSQRVPYATLWALGLLAVSEPFLYRMSLPRPLSLSLAVLVIGMLWMFEGKHRRLIPLAFLYVWLYDAFPLLVLLALLYVLAAWMVERRLSLRPVLYAAGGTLLGLLINPYSPDNLVFFTRHVLPKLFEATAIPVGTEWYPYDTLQLVENSPLTLAALISAVIALGLSGRRMDTQTAASLFAAILFGAMLFQSRRFIEYFPAFTLIFTAFAWRPLISSGAEAGDFWGGSFRSFWQSRNWIAPSILAVFLIAGLWNTLPAAGEMVRGSIPYTRYAQAAAWLEENTPEGSRVFQTDWDDFPRLFYYNSHNTYLIGLDPTFLQLYDDQLYDLWADIVDGQIERPSEMIISEFQASYVFTDLSYDNFIEAARADPGMEEVYRDEDAVIYRVIRND